MNEEELKQALNEQAELENAIKIIRQNGYIVTKWTKEWKKLLMSVKKWKSMENLKIVVAVHVAFV